MKTAVTWIWPSNMDVLWDLESSKNYIIFSDMTKVSNSNALDVIADYSENIDLWEM